MALTEPRFVDGEAMHVAGLSGEYTRETTSEIPAQWDRFNGELGRVANVDLADDSTYGVVYPAAIMRYISGVRLRQGAGLPKGWVEVEVPAQRYAVFADTGGVPRIREVWREIFSDWLAASGMRPADGPMVERYPEDYMRSGDFEIWIPLQ